MSEINYIFFNGRLLTAPRPASALAVSGPWLAYVGDDTSARTLAASNTKLVNLAGMTVVPGLVDAHTHMVD